MATTNDGRQVEAQNSWYAKIGDPFFTPFQARNKSETGDCLRTEAAAKEEAQSQFLAWQHLNGCKMELGLLRASAGHTQTVRALERIELGLAELQNQLCPNSVMAYGA